MGQSKKAAKAEPRHTPVQRAATPACKENSALSRSAHFKVVSNGPLQSSPRASAGPAAPAGALSVRAENVLKELAVELVGESPPQGRWIPPDVLVQRLTYKDLSTARNCGPKTTAEIIKWAHDHGTIIQRSFHTGTSLSAMWQCIIAKFSEGEILKNEVAEALEKSTRRGNTRIPVAFQRMLLQFVNSK